MKTPIGLAVDAIVAIADESVSMDEKETLMGLVGMLENEIKPREKIAMENAFINGEISILEMINEGSDINPDGGKDRADSYYKKEYL